MIFTLISIYLTSSLLLFTFRSPMCTMSDDRPVGEPDIEVEGTARPQLFSGDLPTGE